DLRAIDPGLIAGSICIDWFFLVLTRDDGSDLQRGVQALAAVAAERQALRVDRDFGRFGQAQRLEELLDAAHALGRRTLHGVGPAVAREPAGDGAVLKVGGSVFRTGFGILGDLSRRVAPVDLAPFKWGG